MVAKTYPVVSSFAAGELTPRMWARIDLDIYGNAVQTMSNFVSRPHGSAVRRSGLEKMFELQGYSLGRIFIFQISDTETAAVVVVNGKMFISSTTGFGAWDNLVANPEFTGGATSWTPITVSGGTVVFNAAQGRASLTVTSAAGSIARIRQQVGAVTPNQPHELVIGMVLAPGRTYNVKVGTAAGGNQLGEFNTTAQSFRVSIPIATPAGVWVEVSLIGGGTAGSIVIDFVGFFKPNVAPTTFLEVVTPWLEGDLPTLQARMLPQDQAMWFTHQLHPPQELKYNKTTQVWTLAVLAFTGAPTTWATGNYPGTFDFFEGRSWWGGTPNEPATFNASKSGAFTDLVAGTTASDGMTFTLSRPGVIRWIYGGKSLLIGTSRGEFIIRAEVPPIKPGDILAEQQSAFGSAPRQALPVGASVLYGSPDGRRLRVMNYQWEENAWLSTDLSFTAEHITKNLLRAFCFCRNPDNVMWATDFKGVMIACSYEPSLKIVGWHRHPGWAPLVDVINEENSGISTLWVLRRCFTAASQPYLLIERMSDQAFMDSFTTKVFVTPTSVVTGLDYLEGQIVQVVVDSWLHPDVVVTGGQITLQRAGLEVHIGKQYTSQLITLPLDQAGEGGSTQVLNKRWNKIWARIYDSAMPIINGVRPPDRTPSTPMDEGEPLVTRDVKVTSLGWSQQYKVEIVQDLPYNLEVLGLFGEAGVGAT